MTMKTMYTESYDELNPFELCECERREREREKKMATQQISNIVKKTQLTFSSGEFSFVELVSF